jgi:hypothetical protein
VEILPPEARDAEIAYQNCTEQLETLTAEHQAKTARVKELNELLKHKHQYAEFQRLSAEKATLRIQDIQEAIRKARLLGRAACDEAYAATFYHVAKMIVKSEVLLPVLRETERLLGHGWREGVGNAYSDTSDGYKARASVRETLRRRRRGAEATAERLKSDDSFQPDGRQHKGVMITETAVADLAARRAAAETVGIAEQARWAAGQIGRLESLRGQFEARRQVLPRQMLLDLLAARAAAKTLRELAEDDS